MDETLEDQTIVINPETVEDMQGRHIVVSNNGTDFAIYVKEGDSTVGRLFVTMQEMTEITNQFIKNIIDQELDPQLACINKLQQNINQ